MYLQVKWTPVPTARGDGGELGEDLRALAEKALDITTELGPTMRGGG